MELGKAPPTGRKTSISEFLSISGRIYHFRRWLGRSIWWMRIVLKIRNQCLGVVHYFFNEGCVPTQNGERAVIKAFAPISSNFIDVGANVGEWTQAFLDVSGQPSRGLVADPSSSALQALRSKFLQESRVTILEAAFSDREGEAEFFEEPSAGQSSSLVPGFSRTNSCKRMVRVTTLDREVERLGWTSVGFLKVDAEGHDLHVLRGARNLLSTHRIDVIQFEYNAPWKRAGSHLAEAVELLQGFGYRIYLIKQAGLLHLECNNWLDYYDYSNYLAVRADKVIPPTLRVHEMKFRFW